MQDDIASARHARMEGNPASLMPHDLDDHHTLMRACRRMQAVDGFGGDTYCRIETERSIGAPHIGCRWSWESSLHSRPLSTNRAAVFCVPFPPMHTRQSNPCLRMVCIRIAGLLSESETLPPRRKASRAMYPGWFRPW